MFDEADNEVTPAAVTFVNSLGVDNGGEVARKMLPAGVRRRSGRGVDPVSLWVVGPTWRADDDDADVLVPLHGIDCTPQRHADPATLLVLDLRTAAVLTEALRNQFAEQGSEAAWVAETDQQRQLLRQRRKEGNL